MHTQDNIRREVIAVHIREVERQEGFKLTTEDFDFLIESLIQFNTQAINKFIDGGKRHYDEDFPNFTDGSINYLTELRKEVVDSWMYLLAEQHRQHRK